MRAKVVSSLIGLILIAVIAAGLALSRGSDQSTSASPKSGQGNPKRLREIAMERDVEVTGRADHSEYVDFDAIAKDVDAIVYGRIADSKSYFDESDPLIDVITTEYDVEVLRVLKDRTSETMLPAGRPAPAPLTTTLKIKRNGGVVFVNGHRVSVKVKGFDEITSGQKCVFFLFWGPAYKAYYPAGGNSGVVLVNDNFSLRSLASSETMQTRIRGMNLDNLSFRLRN